MDNKNTELLGLSCIILAAGASRRLGSPKQLLNYQGQLLIQRAITSAQTICGPSVSIIIGANQEQLLPHVSSQGASVYINKDWEVGVSSSIKLGIEQLSSKCSAVMIMVCDQPLLTEQDLRILSNLWQQNKDNIVASTYNNTTGVPAIFPRRYFSQLTTLSGDKGAKKVITQDINSVILAPIPNAAFDVDNKDDAHKMAQLENNSLLPSDGMNK